MSTNLRSDVYWAMPSPWVETKAIRPQALDCRPWDGACSTPCVGSDLARAWARTPEPRSLSRRQADVGNTNATRAITRWARIGSD